MRVFRWVSLAVALLLLASGCGSTAGKQWEDGKLKVVATTGMVADIARNVGGQHVSVIALMGPGIDPHLYKATSGDLTRLNQAELIFYNGLQLEGKLEAALARVGKSKPTVAVAEGVPTERLLDDQESGHPDPHIWFDVALWMTAVDVVRDSLVAADPANQADYKANASAYLEELADLHEWVKAEIGRIPTERRLLVTAHDAFGYFGEAYGIEVMALQGLSTDAEYGLADVQGLVDTLVDRQIKAVFFESSIPQRSINAVVEGAKAKGHQVAIGGELFSDAMGAPGTAAGTYIGMVRHNVSTIVNALK